MAMTAVLWGLEAGGRLAPVGVGFAPAARIWAVALAGTATSEPSAGCLPVTVAKRHLPSRSW